MKTYVFRCEFVVTIHSLRKSTETVNIEHFGVRADNIRAAWDEFNDYRKKQWEGARKIEIIGILEDM